MKKIATIPVIVEVFELEKGEDSHTSAQSPTKGYTRAYSDQWDRIFSPKKEGLAN